MLATFLIAVTVSASAPVRVAAPKFAASGVAPDVASSLERRFTQELAKTPVEVTPTAEGGAVDAYVLGRVSKLGDAYHIDLEVLDAVDGPPVAIYSVDAAEERWAEHLTHAARVVANAVLVEHGRLGIDPGGLPRNLVTFSPPGVYFGFYGAEYERVLFDQLSAFVSATLLSLDWQEDYLAPLYSGFHGYLFSLGARWYPWRQAPSGFFVDLEVRFGDSTSTVPWSGDFPLPMYKGDPNVFRGFTILPAGMVGYTMLLAGNIPVSIGLGVGSNGVHWFIPDIGVILRINTGIGF